jgi:hypothetical protein
VHSLCFCSKESQAVSFFKEVPVRMHVCTHTHIKETTDY